MHPESPLPEGIPLIAAGHGAAEEPATRRRTLLHIAVPLLLIAMAVVVVLAVTGVLRA
jgi:hypothetical protein